MPPCSVCCDRPAARKKGGKCERCAKWGLRNPGKPPGKARPYGQKTRDRLLTAALRYTNAEDDEEFRKARELLIKYAQQQAKVRMRQVVEQVTEAVLRRLRMRDIGKTKMSRTGQTMPGTSLGEHPPTPPHGDDGTT